VTQNIKLAMVFLTLLNSAYYMKITIGQNRNGIIVVDVNAGFAAPLPPGVSGQRLEIPVTLDRMDFLFEDGKVRIIDATGTTLVPTVYPEVSSLEFNPGTNELRVLGAAESPLSTPVSTSGKQIIARVDFSSATITLFQ
jgi:hypothetical protein